MLPNDHGKLLDTTLREGEQSYGVYLSMDAKRDLVQGLSRVGIEEIEIGYVGQEGLGALIPFARETGMKSISLWSPCRGDDASRGFALGADRVNLGVPVSDAHLEKRLGLDRDGLLFRLERVAERVGENTINLTAGLEDISRADMGFVMDVVRHVHKLGFGRLRLSDTVGQLTPLEMVDMVNAVRDIWDRELAVHCHNDFGMGTANAIAALEAGANFADVSVLGLGERAGIARLEEVAAFLTLRRGQSYDLRGMSEVEAIIAKGAQLALPRNRPVTGSDIFACESGLHVHGVTRDPSLFEPYAPEEVAADRRIGIGKKSGAAAVIKAARELGYEIEGSQVSGLVRMVRLTSELKGRPLSWEELSSLAARHGSLKKKDRERAA